MNVNVYNAAGEVAKTIDLNPKIFDVASKADVVSRAVLMQQANSRQVLAHTKTKAEVRGGGKKPWRQKGTGRARQGSIRSPQWVGGGIVFGPRKDRNFTVRMNKKEWRKALFMVLSDKAQHERLVVLDQLTLAESKTRAVVALLKKLPSAAAKSTLLVQPAIDREFGRAARNLPKVQTIQANSLNVVDVMKSDYVVLPEAALDVIQKTFLATK